MRYMVMVKGDADYEAGKLPPKGMLEAMTKFNEELVSAGILVSGEGLQPSSKGAIVKYSGKKRTVVDGPFAEAKELVGGFWIWNVKSREECIEWAKKIPFGEGSVEIRKVSEPEDFGEAMTPELAEREKKIFEKAQAQQKKK